MGLSSSKTKVVEVGGCYWHVGRLLGKGAYSTVKQLSNKELGKELAVKLIDKRLLLSRGTGSITGALAERDILNTYAHPFFVNMVASFESNTHLIIILELRSGGSLGYHLTQRHRFSEDETRWVAASLLLALQHLRTWGVAHRDIKPENMLFDERGYIYLSDFNCARFINRERPQLQGRAGTLDYMAPEMFSGSYNLSCDVWSTGILLYRMIYGRVPWRVIDRQPTFDRRSKSAEHNLSKLSRVDRRRVHMIKHAQIPYPVRPDLPAAVPAFLSRLLERDHSIRATPAELMTDPWLETVDWAAMLRHEPIAPFIPKPGRSNIPAEVLFNDQFATPHKAPPKASKKPLSPEEQDRFAGWKEWTSPAYCQFLADSLATIQSSSSSSSSSSSATSSSSSTASLAAPSCQSSSFATYSFPLSSATSSALSSSPPSTSSFSSSSYCLPSSSSASSLYSLNYSLPSPPSSPPPISLAPSEISKYHRRSLLRGSEGLRERRMTSSASTPANDSMAELAIQKVQSSLSSPSLSEASESEAVIERQVHSDIKMRKSVPSRSRRRRSSREAKLPTSVHPLSLATETSPQGETPPFARTSPQLVEHRSQESGLTASGSPNDFRKIRSAEAILHKGAGENLRGENKRNRPRHPKKSRSPRPQHPENHPV